ncbi:MAG: hypothetical protein K0R41_2186, partial [Geminicoccaceae bacterium]|nr:hypothetical protein [Geminicoccaceae bacterium]
ACWLLALPLAATAAVLIEAEKAGQPLRLVVDRAQQRVLLTTGASRALVDLAGGAIYLQQADGPAKRVPARYRPGYVEPAGYRVERFGPGPMVAGHASTYYVLFDEERVCAEAMLNDWMRPFVDPAVRALALLEQLSAPGTGDACAAIPFATYAAAGWPLMAGKADRPTFVTKAIRFDYQPSPGELALPAGSRDATSGEVAGWIGLPPS